MYIMVAQSCSYIYVNAEYFRWFFMIWEVFIVTAGTANHTRKNSIQNSFNIIYPKLKQKLVLREKWLKSAFVL